MLVEDDDDAMKDIMRLERFVMVGISCIQYEPWLRPSIKKVVQMLDGAITVSRLPNMFTIRISQAFSYLAYTHNSTLVQHNSIMI